MNKMDFHQLEANFINSLCKHWAHFD